MSESESESESESVSDAESEPDAVALFRPARPEALKPFLDLDDDDDSEGIYAEPLEDGSFLLYTFQPFAVFAESPQEARTWLAQFGDALDDVHDDPRGVLFFPDTLEPEATTYAGVVEQAAEEGMWISLAAEIAPGLPAGLDMEALQAIASQLMGAAPGGGTPASSFDLAKMLEGMQGHLAEAFGIQGQAAEKPAAEDDAYDDEFAPAEADEKKPKP